MMLGTTPKDKRRDTAISVPALGIFGVGIVIDFLTFFDVGYTQFSWDIVGLAGDG